MKYCEMTLEVNTLGVIRHVLTHEIQKLTPQRDRTLPGCRNRGRTQEGKLLCHVRCDDGKRRTVYPHIEVARNWSPNPENKPTVDHIDGNYTNNEWWNLRWATYAEQQAFRRAKATA